MAIIKKTQLAAMSDAERTTKIAELERSMLELRGEGRKDKTKSLRKAIARLKTPRAQDLKNPVRSGTPSGVPIKAKSVKNM